MTIKNLYPDSRPQSIYNVINGRPELPAASTFSRASEANYVDSTGIIQTAAVDEPRFNYDSSTGEFLGLLLEPESQNEVLNNLPDIKNAAVTRKSDRIGISFWETVEISGDSPYVTTGVINNNGTYTASFLVDMIQTDSLLTAVSISMYVPGSSSAKVIFVRDGVDGLVYDRKSNGSLISIIDYSITKWGYGLYRVSITGVSNASGTGQARLYIGGGNSSVGCVTGGYQWERINQLTSLILSSAIPTVRKADSFSLTSSNNFDGGFSLLLDSETATEDFVYKIKAGGTVISELKNDNGTLEWDVNGTSAQTDDLYPQVGFVTGRVRTVSSYGAADGTVQNNYLYTTGLSFPTPAVVAPGADELEFGIPQTLKALYLWNGQLSDTEAVSVIKGEYNVVPIKPIEADTYSFVYNTDPTNNGETSMDLPYIVPTESMRIYWGDGTNQRYEQGVLPQHAYPYPGQYRIQIEADDGFDGLRLADEAYTITRVDQWPPQGRVGASGPGFTGDDLSYILNLQTRCAQIPDFKYSGITSLRNAFNATSDLAPNGPDNTGDWSWVPTNLTDCTDLTTTFYGVGNASSPSIGATTAQRAKFPQLTTSNKLTTVQNVFFLTYLSGFYAGGVATSPPKPFTDTSAVTNWSGAFYGCQLTDIDIDTSAGTDFELAFYGGAWTTFPGINLNNAKNLKAAWKDSTQMTGFSTTPNTSKVTNWEETFNKTAYVNFPLFNTSSGTNFTGTWSQCEFLTSLPLLDVSSGTTFVNAWNKCISLTSFPALNFESATNLNAAWTNCTELLSFPLIQNTSKVTNWRGTWQETYKMASMAALDFSAAENFEYTWYKSGITSLPNGLDFSKVNTILNAWNTTQITTWPSYLDEFPEVVIAQGGFSKWQGTTFPKVDFPKVEQINAAWISSPSLANFTAGSYPNCTSFVRTWEDCGLTAASIESILVSINSNGLNNGELGIDGGTNAGKSTWTAAAVAAFDNLITKGWTISFNA